MMIGACLITMLLVWVAASIVARRGPRSWLALTLAGSAAALTAAFQALGNSAEWTWRSSWSIGGEPVHLRLDGLSGCFLVLVAAIGAAGAVYARTYWPDRDKPASATRGRLWWSTLLASMALVLLGSNGLHFLMAWEAFAIAAYFLITLDRTRYETRSAGYLYLAASHAGTLCLFAFFSLLAGRTGTWDLGPLRERADLAPLFWLALAGFGLKAGMFPVHIWLPSAHANAPSHVSAVMSGVAIKMGLYGIVRFSGWLSLPPGAGWVVLALGGVSALLGAALALAQNDLKRLLAYSSVENMGVILIGIGTAMLSLGAPGAGWGPVALSGALYHAWSHGLFKGLLFLGAGSVLHATGTREMSRMGGLWKAMPWTAALFAFGSLAVSALPPLNGFVGEWLIYTGLFESAVARTEAALGTVPAVIALAVTGALALGAFVKASAIVFLGAPRTKPAAQAHECGWGMRAPMLVLAAACCWMGMAPTLVWPWLARSLEVWNPAWTGALAPAELGALGRWQILLGIAGALGVAALWNRSRSKGVRRSLTWDCGYAAPTSRMQYTSGSFGAVVVGWITWMLKPMRRTRSPRGPFPRGARQFEKIPEPFLERVVFPAADRVLGLSGWVRRYQHGRLQDYILYVVVGVMAIGAVVYFESLP